MTLQFITSNATFAFFFGASLIRMGDEPMFFETRREAVYAAKVCGLKVTNRNTVKIGENR